VDNGELMGAIRTTLRTAWPGTATSA